MDHMRVSPFHHPTPGKQHNERVDLFTLRGNAALKQQSSFIHHRLSKSSRSVVRRLHPLLYLSTSTQPDFKKHKNDLF